MSPDTVRIKNLDVLGLDQEPKFGGNKGRANAIAPDPLLSSLGAHTAQLSQGHEHQCYRDGGTKYISVRQATNIIEAVDFAKLISLPLVAHLSIEWSLTDAGDDPDGKLFAKFREGFAKWLLRHGIEFAAVWCRERRAGGQSDVVHCHVLFHLPVNYRRGSSLIQTEAAICRLIKRHGRDISDERVIKLVIHDKPPYPDGKYLIKGGGPKVWKRVRLRKEHCCFQGIIHGKRCGTTENIGPAARHRMLAADKKQGGAA